MLTHESDKWLAKESPSIVTPFHSYIPKDASSLVSYDQNVPSRLRLGGFIIGSRHRLEGTLKAVARVPLRASNITTEATHIMSIASHSAYGHFLIIFNLRTGEVGP